MVLICLTDNLNGVPWELQAIGNDPYYQGFYKLGYIINPEKKVKDHLKVTELEYPIFIIANHTQDEWKSDTFYSLKKYISKGKNYVYSEFEEMLDEMILLRKALTNKYEESFPLCTKEFDSARSEEYFYFQFGSNMDDYTMNYDYLKAINFRFNLNSCQLDLNCYKKLRKNLKLDPEIPYIIHYIKGDSNIQLLEQDNINNDDHIKENYIRELRS